MHVYFRICIFSYIHNQKKTLWNCLHEGIAINRNEIIFIPCRWRANMVCHALSLSRCSLLTHLDQLGVSAFRVVLYVFVGQNDSSQEVV